MKTARVLTLCIVAALCACHRDSDTPLQPVPTPQISAPVVAKKGPSAADLTAGMVEAVSQGKSQLAVQLKFDLQQRPVLGQTLDIDLAVVPQIDAGGANILVTGGDGLTVFPGTGQIDLPAVQAGQVYRHSVKVTPTVDGVLLLSFNISLKHDEMTESRLFTIPLIVER